MKLWQQLCLVTLLAAATIGWLWWRSDDMVGLWMTPDQQGRARYEALEFADAAELFEDPMWRGVALCDLGRYAEAADAFALEPSAVGFYDRGNALVKGREYARAIESYELAVDEAPDWVEARENLRLARHILDYLEETREQSDTGDESELGADDIKFDNEKKKGLEITITKESTIEAASAEKWMRSVDTETRDFLRVRFALEAAAENGP